MSPRVLHLFFLMLMYFPVTGQVDTAVILDQNELENIVENQELEGDLDVINSIDQLENFRSSKLNLNTADYDELNALRILNEYQIQSLINYRFQFGPLLSKYEMQALPGWDITTIRLIAPYVSIGSNTINKEDLKNMVSKGKHDLFLKAKRVLSDRVGFDPDKGTNYLGDPNNLFIRYRYNYSNKLRWGLTAEKDPGEQFFKGVNKNGFDFYSGFIFYKNSNSPIKFLALGDYTISMGQGLIVHNSFGSGKSSQVINIVKGGAPIRPYSSVNEALFMRGAAGTIKLSDHIDLTSFVSVKNRTGNILSDTIIDAGFESFSSIRLDGYHRTDGEIEDKSSIREINTGGIIRYHHNNLRVNANILHTKFNRFFDPSDELYRKFTFSGDRLTNVSLDGLYQYTNFNIFWEYARSDNGANALVTGSQIVLNPKFDLSLVYRRYDEDYQVLNANAFGEYSSPANEQGLYLGVAYRANKEWLVSAYHDVWKSPWLRFRVDGLSDGKESFLRVDYKKRYQYHFYLQYKFEDKAFNLNSDGPIRNIGSRKLHRLRIHLENSINNTLDLRNRVEYSFSNSTESESSGWLIYQDVILKTQSILRSLTARLAYFDTDDFESRIYAYENDILYEFRIPFYQNEGLRFYVNSRWKLSRKLTFEFRYEVTSYFDDDEIGSGGETILGNNRSEIKTQIRYQF